MRFRLILIFLVFLSWGCNVKTDEKYIIGFSQCTGGDEWRKAMLDGMKRELAFYPNTELIFKDAKANSQTQVAQIRELLKSGINLLIVSPNEAEPLTPIVEEAYKNGIPVVVVDRRTSSPYFTAYVGGDNYEVGKTAGQYIASILKGKGKIIEITGLPKSSPASDRNRGLKDAIASHPDIQLVATLNGQWEKPIAKKELSKILPKYPDLSLIFATTSSRVVCFSSFSTAVWVPISTSPMMSLMLQLTTQPLLSR